MISRFDEESKKADQKLQDVTGSPADYQAIAGGPVIPVIVTINLDVITEPQEGGFETAIPANYIECVLEKAAVQLPARGDTITIPSEYSFIVDSINTENSDDLNWALMVHE